MVADADGGSGIRLAAPEGPATIESDAAVRVLLLWGRRPADPARWRSAVGPDTLRRVRTLLGGYGDEALPATGATRQSAARPRYRPSAPPPASLATRPRVRPLSTDRARRASGAPWSSARSSFSLTSSQASRSPAPPPRNRVSA